MKAAFSFTKSEVRRRRLRSSAGPLIWPVALISLALLSGCNFAPTYSRPTVQTPRAYKELTPENFKDTAGWKSAEPKDDVLRGDWWKMFNDARLALLVEEATVFNQGIAAALANSFAAQAVVKQARSQYFPTLSIAPSVSESRLSATFSSTNSPLGNFTSPAYLLPLSASWQPDFWGSVRNTVKSSLEQAQATLADLENARLVVAAQVASNYFQIRGLDAQKELLDSTVMAYRESLNLTKARYDSGIASDQDVAQAEAVLNSAMAQATDLGVQRAQFEHAIALLMGKPASVFSIPYEPLKARPLRVPFGVPSALLERRPDIAGAERRVAAANAQIGVARAAYFPTVTLTGSAGFQSLSIANLMTWPSFAWSVGATVAETIFDAGRRKGVTEQAWANYQITVANYRQTVLAAFQEVENGLSTLRILSQELEQQSAAVESSRRYLTIATDRYKLGIDSYLNVIAAQTILLGNERTLVTLQTQQILATVQLITALGGGWNVAEMPWGAETSQGAGSQSLPPSREW